MTDRDDRDRHTTDQLDRIEQALTDLTRRITAMAISQEQFDTDLAALTGAITTLISAVDAAIAAKPAADLTAEDQAVQAASQAVSAELAKITPPPAPTTP